MSRPSRLAALIIAIAFTSAAAPAGAAVEHVDLHAVMVNKLGGSCRLDQSRLARFEPRMIVVHAAVDQTTLPRRFARATVLTPLLGGLEAGDVLPLLNRHRGIGGAQGAHLAEGKQYLISIFRYRDILVVDRALECQGV